MSRGTPEHARLSARIVRLIGNALAGDCEVYSSDMMRYVAEAGVGRQLGPPGWQAAVSRHRPDCIAVR